MTFPRSALTALTCAALAATAAAQSSPAMTESGMPAPGTPAGQIVPAQAGAQPAQEEVIESKPRFMRGNDVVVAPAKEVPPITGAPLSFNFEDAPVAEVVRTLLGDILKTPYVLHPPLTGSVTLSTRVPIAPDQAVFLLESALQANGLAMLRDARGTYHVGKPDLLRGIGGTIRQAGKTAPLPPGYGAIIVPLQYIGAAEMAAILKPMVPAEAIIRVDPLRNLLVMAGTRTQAEGWLDLVNTFDVDLLKGMSVGMIPLKNISIEDVETAIRLMTGSGLEAAGSGAAGATGSARGGSSAVAAGSAGQGGAGGRQGAAAPTGGTFFGGVRIVPVERLNSILVVTPRASALEEARRWIEKIDQPIDNGAEPQLYIYKVQNGNARHLAGVLSGIFGGMAGGGASANSGIAPGLGGGSGNSGFGNSGFGNSGFGNSGFGNSGFGNSGFGNSGFGSSSGFGGSSAFGNRTSSGQFGQNANNTRGTGQGASTALIGNIRVMADELNNSILVWGTKSEFSKIEPTLKRLDLPPTQVLIDASIVEVTLDDTLNYGLQWAFSGGSGSYDGAGVLASGDLKAPPSVTSLNTISASQGFTYSLLNSAGNVRVILNALASKGLVKMVSNPSLMVLDNHVAQMSVGNQVPVPTSLLRDTTGATTQGYQYRDTGVNLAVTPSVNAGNLVTMQIDQTLTDTLNITNGAAQPTFLQRQIASKVAVRSGETVVLGGLIKDTQSNNKSGVPLLQDIPLVGNLFSTNSRGGNRTELLVILTPRVVRTDPEIREVSEDLRDRLRGLRAVEERNPRSQSASPAPAANLPLPINPLPPQ
ncbi:type II secretion system secretin GspD [Acidovorax sp. Leaf160]|uniref:type II secretion system secretin GspD n=1 Tax=Acidovorax sp. Leaf160 TaxID=1736280 RepID=UPI0006FD4A9C|nr:type II secretion system secretin GspD [Acidovorax sp. Leaf160]KQR41391.1 type II secretion system protein GspD [Acidovorax sp. Leaf160]